MHTQIHASIYIYIHMYADAAISDIAMRPKSFWEIGDLFTPDSIEGTGPEEGWVSIKISGKVQFSRCAEVGCLEDGLPICFSAGFLPPRMQLGGNEGFWLESWIPKVINLGFDLTNLVLDDLPPSSCSTCSALTS